MQVPKVPFGNLEGTLKGLEGINQRLEELTEYMNDPLVKQYLDKMTNIDTKMAENPKLVKKILLEILPDISKFKEFVDNPPTSLQGLDKQKADTREELQKNWQDLQTGLKNILAACRRDPKAA